MDYYTEFNIIKAYSGFLQSDAMLLKSSSGGAATAYSELFINNGGVVFGVRYTNDYKSAEYAIAHTLKDLESFKGSKYITPSKKVQDIDGTEKSVYELVGDYLSKEIDVLFIGLGCDVGAVRAYCEKKNISQEHLVCVEILCHGPTINDVHEQYISYLEKKFSSNLKYFTVRMKKGKTKPWILHAEFENGKIYEIPFVDSDYGIAFVHITRKSCFNCHFKGNKHRGDVIIGDYNGMPETEEGWNEKGVSIILVKSDVGMEITKKLVTNKTMVLSEANLSLVLDNNKMYYMCMEKPLNYDKLLISLHKKGLHKTVQNIVGFKFALKRNIKHVVPQKAYNLIKKLISK